MARLQWFWRNGRPPIVRPVKAIVMEFEQYRLLPDDMTIGIIVWNHYNDLGRPEISLKKASIEILVKSESNVTVITIMRLLSGYTLLPQRKTLQAVTSFLGIDYELVEQAATHPNFRIHPDIAPPTERRVSKKEDDLYERIYIPQLVKQSS